MSRNIPAQVAEGRGYICKEGHKMKLKERDDDYGCDARGCLIQVRDKCYECLHASHGEYGYVVCIDCA
jgi:hypothetical protein